VKDRTVELLPQPLLDKIGAVATVRTFPKRAIIVTEGDEHRLAYVMLSGKARVFVADEKGREVQLNQLGAGEYFGEVTLDGGPRSASVMAVRRTAAARSSKRTELTPFPREESRARPAYRAQARAPRARPDRERAQPCADGRLRRVARLLLELAEEKDGRMVVNEPLTHKDIASRVGASREMISRIFSDLSDGGYIRKEDRLLVIARKPPPRW
jgi:CRP/FNR family cyclic AMP-dependent transcriptional regulator